MVKAKKDGDETYESISSFFMANCKCEKSPNEYYQWNCSRRSCKTCKDCKPAELKCQTSNEIVSVDQFEVVTKEYLKFNKKTKEVEKKSTKLTDRVSSQMTYKDLYKVSVKTTLHISIMFTMTTITGQLFFQLQPNMEKYHIQTILRICLDYIRKRLSRVTSIKPLIHYIALLSMLIPKIDHWSHHSVTYTIYLTTCSMTLLSLVLQLKVASLKMICQK